MNMKVGEERDRKARKSSFRVNLMIFCTIAGLGKGYYARVKLPVTTEDGSKVEAQVYVKTTSSEKLRAGPFLEEYTLEFHKANYRAIRHIMVRAAEGKKSQLSTHGRE